MVYIYGHCCYCGQADTVTDPQVSQRLYEQVASRDKTIKFWPGARHTDAFHGGLTQTALMEEANRTVAEWMYARA